MADYKTTYIDKTGKTHEGVVKEGKTYTATGERVPVGSLVNTAGGQFLMTDKGGVAYDPAKSSYSGLNKPSQSGGGGSNRLSSLSGVPTMTDSYTKQLLDNQAKLSGLYKSAAEAKYNELASQNTRDRLAAGKAYQQQYGNYLTNLRSQRGEALQTGASKGMQMSQEISSMLGLGQAAGNIETQYANQSRAIADQKGTALAQADLDAMTSQNEILTSLAAQEMQKYGIDVGLYGTTRGQDLSYASNIRGQDLNYGATIRGQDLQNTQFYDNMVQDYAKHRENIEADLNLAKINNDAAYSRAKLAADNALALLDKEYNYKQLDAQNKDALVMSTFGPEVAAYVKAGGKLEDALTLSNMPSANRYTGLSGGLKLHNWTQKDRAWYNPMKYILGAGTNLYENSVRSITGDPGYQLPKEFITNPGTGLSDLIYRPQAGIYDTSGRGLYDSQGGILSQPVYDNPLIRQAPYFNY